MFDSCFLKLFLKIVFEKTENVNYSCYLSFVFFVFSRTNKSRNQRCLLCFTCSGFSNQKIVFKNRKQTGLKGLFGCENSF